MKRTIIALFVFLCSYCSAQSNFTLEFTAPEFLNKILFISPEMSTGNVEKLYNIDINQNDSIVFYKDMNAASIPVRNTNFITGKVGYPQPLSFSFINEDGLGGQNSLPFFVEKGYLKLIVIKEPHLLYRIISSTPANVEYGKLKLLLKKYDDHLKIFSKNIDHVILEAKELVLQKYIKKNPSSFVAFWETVFDFSNLGYNEAYFENLRYFSLALKKSEPYIKFKKLLEIQQSTAVGAEFPVVNFNNKESITREDFSRHKLTLIDYWATSCVPCIKGFPDLVELHEIYKDAGLNFITVTDESQKNKIDLANKILKDNNITWKNYFDTNKKFVKQLNASGYPLQILVDSNGKIIAREVGEIDKLKIEINKYLQ